MIWEKWKQDFLIQLAAVVAAQQAGILITIDWVNAENKLSSYLRMKKGCL